MSLSTLNRGLYETIVPTLLYVSPLVLLLYVGVVTLFHSFTVSRKTRNGHRSRLIGPLIFLLVLTYAGQLVTVLTASYSRTDVEFPIPLTIHCSFMIFFWTAISRSKDPIPHMLAGCSAINIVSGVIFLFLDFSPAQSNSFGRGQTVTQGLSVVLLVAVLSSTILSPFCEGESADEEIQPFLPKTDGDRQAGSSFYGITETDKPSRDKGDGDNDDDEGEDDGDEYIKQRQRQRLQKSGNWLTYLKAYWIFVPFLIPKKDRIVQICILINIACLLAERVLNILRPRQFGIITDLLISGAFPLKELAIWLMLTILDGGAGLGLVQNLVKIPIQQFSYRQVTNAAFNHVMGLSIDFHNDKDSAEVMKAIEQGESLNNLIEVLISEISPAIVDTIVGYVYIYKVFDMDMAAVLFTASAAYVYLDISLTNCNMDNRRNTTKAVRAEAKAMHQAVQGWHIVSYFNQFDHEKHRFAQAVQSYLAVSRRYLLREAYTSAFMHLIIPLTFFSMSGLAMYRISRGHASPGDFVFFLQYWGTLISPITYLSSHYRWLAADLIDAERLLVLFQTSPKITNSSSATSLQVTHGGVEFNEVDFAYDDRNQILHSISISALPGQTVALVGETGSGKSTILKLLYRFYDISSGFILIDGQNIANVTLNSLRDALGVVPQDPDLFNTTILENVRYARLDASDEDVQTACKAAAVHEQIMSFPLAYKTRVGENGVKLSGGELQRIAIARVLLKNPKIVLLDEATSAVDTETEVRIQEALRRLGEGRTTFVIAHRLSTVVAADLICVVSQGRIVEKGTHEELLRSEGGKYRALWRRQGVDGSDSLGIRDD